MALRNQPYIPLYVQDFSGDERLRECSAASCGVYIFIMCVMHKSDEYGSILLRQSERQTGRLTADFAAKLSKHLPYKEPEIEAALDELIEYRVLRVEGNRLYQKRMVKDGQISEARALAGKRGASKTNNSLTNTITNLSAKRSAKGSANTPSNSEYESDSVNEYITDNEVIDNESKPKKKAAKFFKPPTVGEVREYCASRKNEIDAEEFVAFYASKGWMVGSNKMKDWKQAVVTWEKRRRENSSGGVGKQKHWKYEFDPKAGEKYGFDDAASDFDDDGNYIGK